MSDLDTPIIPDWMKVRPRAKLTFDARCSLFALYHKIHVSVEQLSQIFGVTPVAAYQIVRLDPKQYANVYHTYKTIGLERMYADYVSQDHLNALRTFVDKNMSREEARVMAISTGAPNKRYNQRAGDQIITSQLGDDIPIHIAWLDDFLGKAGWFAKSRNDSQGYFGDNGEPFRTSTEAYDWCVNNLI